MSRSSPMGTLHSAPAEDGFSLVELMAVVTIISIFATAATVHMGRQHDPDDLATDLATRIRECNRLAVSGGPVRPDVLEALGSRARARLIVSVVGDEQEVSLERLVEDALPSDDASWMTVSSMRLTDDVRVTGSLSSASLDSGLGPGSPISGDVVVNCFPTGNADAATLYLGWDGADAERARVVVLPMSSEPIVLDGW